MRGSGLSVLLAGCMIFVLTACTPVTEARNPHPTLIATATATAISAAHVVLKCAEGTPGGPSIPTNLRITDTVGTAFVRNPISDIPRAEDVGIPSPSSAKWTFRKSPLFLAEAAGQVIINVPDDGRQYLLWVPTEAWVNDSPLASKEPWITHQIIANGCAATGVTFLGGVLALDPTRCFTLSMESATGLREELDVRTDGTSCAQ